MSYNRGRREHGSLGRYSDQGSTAAAVYGGKRVKEGKGAKGAKGVITALALLLNLPLGCINATG